MRSIFTITQSDTVQLNLHIATHYWVFLLHDTRRCFALTEIIRMSRTEMGVIRRFMLVISKKIWVWKRLLGATQGHILRPSTDPWTVYFKKLVTKRVPIFFAFAPHMKHTAIDTIKDNLETPLRLRETSLLWLSNHSLSTSATNWALIWHSNIPYSTHRIAHLLGLFLQSDY